MKRQHARAYFARLLARGHSLPVAYAETAARFPGSFRDGLLLPLGALAVHPLDKVARKAELP